MTGHMIERIARTLCRLDGNPENIRFERGQMWESYEATARAIISAMREPTEAMEMAGNYAIGSFLLEGSDGRRSWHAMIDAILAENTE